jgi:hypothetical protein
MARDRCRATDLETLITDLLDGQYNNPVRVIGFNAAEGWSRDASEDVAMNCVNGARAFCPSRFRNSLSGARG